MSSCLQNRGYLALNINGIKENTKVILISPVYDLECSSDAYISDHIKDINFNKSLVKKIFQSIEHKMINDISNINMYIFTSRNELFIYDSYQIYSMNNKAILYLYNNSIHSFFCVVNAYTRCADVKNDNVMKLFINSDDVVIFLLLLYESDSIKILKIFRKLLDIFKLYSIL